MQRATLSQPLHRLNAFLSGPFTAAATAPAGVLHGKTIAIKDSICTSGLPTTCGSRSLEDYRSPYDATVVFRLRGAGGFINGKTNLDEFGMG